MTGTTSPDLDALVAQWNAGRREKALAMLQGHQALMDQLKAEISRLEETGGRRVLLEQDEMSRQLYRVLKAIQVASTTE